jgi:hypothetical protein
MPRACAIAWSSWGTGFRLLHRAAGREAGDALAEGRKILDVQRVQMKNRPPTPPTIYNATGSNARITIGSDPARRLLCRTGIARPNCAATSKLDPSEAPHVLPSASFHRKNRPQPNCGLAPDKSGRPTAGPGDLDIDVLIAAQALSFGAVQTDVTVVTTNPKHLAQFVDARHWSDARRWSQIAR